VELLLQSVSYATSESVPEGKVMQQYPSAGVFVTPGAAVDVVVSTGSAFMYAEDYFVTAEGHGIRYLITDSQGGGFEDHAWAASQYTDDSYDFVITLNGEQSGVLLSNSLGGRRSFSYESRYYLFFQAGFPARHEGIFFMNVMLPTVFVSGESWAFFDKIYSVTHIGAATVGANSFPDCIRVDIDDTGNSSDYLAGTGYFILARDVGIVEIVFQRTDDGSEVRYEYVEHQQLSANTISGTVSVGGEYVSGKIVQIHYPAWGIRSVTDAGGNFALQAYGPVITLRIGDDVNEDGVLDFDVPGWPKEYVVSDITGDVSVDIAF